MTKEDYMKLPKARLAELLAERDAMVPILEHPNWVSSCADPNGVCMNPFHDCVNCPRRGTSGTITTTDFKL